MHEPERTPAATPLLAQVSMSEHQHQLVLAQMHMSPSDHHYQLDRLGPDEPKLHHTV